jgi:hypothetical protein
VSSCVCGSRSVSSRAAPKRRPHDADVPDLDCCPPSEPGDRGEASGAAPAKLVGLHGDVDAAHATL